MRKFSPTSWHLTSILICLPVRLDYLIRTLPASVLESSASLSTDPHLLSIYAQIPFDLFKLCVESPLLPIDPSRVQDRFVLAKKAIAQRKKLGASGKMEEIVALAFNGGEEGSVVHITRRSKKKSTLWKVEG